MTGREQLLVHQVEIIRPDWNAPDNIIAGTTTRRGGFSRGDWSALNLASHVGDDPVNVEQNRSLLVSSLALPADPVWLDQVHGCEVVEADQADAITSCDASISTQAGVVCAVLTADCLPLLLCHESGKIVAAIHAGWRGLAAGVIEQTVDKMQCQGEEIMAWMGPAIGPDVFEVGEEVKAAFVQFDAKAVQAFKPHNDKWLCDIYALARQRLQSLGVGRISGGDLCTYADRQRFYSYRRDGVTGRMVTMVWMDY